MRKLILQINIFKEKHSIPKTFRDNRSVDDLSDDEKNVWITKSDEISAWLVDKRLQKIIVTKFEIENKMTEIKTNLLQNIGDSEHNLVHKHFETQAKAIENYLTKNRNDKGSRQNKKNGKTWEFFPTSDDPPSP